MGDTLVVRVNGGPTRKLDRHVGLKAAVAAMTAGALGWGTVTLYVRRTVSYGTRRERKTGVTRALHARFACPVATYVASLDPLSGGWVAATEGVAALVGAVVTTVYADVPPAYVKTP